MPTKTCRCNNKKRKEEEEKGRKKKRKKRKKKEEKKRRNKKESQKNLGSIKVGLMKSINRRRQLEHSDEVMGLGADL